MLCLHSFSQANTLLHCCSSTPVRFNLPNGRRTRREKLHGRPGTRICTLAHGQPCKFHPCLCCQHTELLIGRPQWKKKRKKKKWRWLAASAVTPLRGTSKKSFAAQPTAARRLFKTPGRPSAACFIFPLFPPLFLFLPADTRWLNSSPHCHRARVQNCSWSVLSATLITPDSPRPVCPLHTGRGQHRSPPRPPRRMV